MNDVEGTVASLQQVVLRPLFVSVVLDQEVEQADRPGDVPRVGGGGLVLVADDEESLLRYCEKALERLGFQTLAAANGEEAVAIFRERAEEIDWVFLDLTMPKMDGVAAFLELRRFRPDIPVIICSGFDEQEATERLQDRGLNGFVKKPYGIEDLRRVADGLPRGRAPAERTS